jgi:hypothetical protein
MRKIIIATVTLFATTAFAQQKDPYADVYANQKRAVYEQNFTKFLDRVKTVSFARHCGVFTNYSQFIGQDCKEAPQLVPVQLNRDHLTLVLIL